MGITKIFCLHGFLGQGKEWEPLQESLLDAQVEHLSGTLDFIAPNLFSQGGSLTPKLSFEDWCESFKEFVNNHQGESNVVLGYSLGGRLALHAVMKYPDLFKAAVFLSTNPTLMTEEEKSQRSMQDLKWAKKFRETAWPQLMEEWNSQPIFAAETQNPERKETSYSRELLALALENWGVAKHLVGLEDLKKIKTPSYWLCGGFDEKFVAIQKMMQKKGVPAQFNLVPEKGHRIGFSHNAWLAEKICNFLESLDSVRYTRGD